MSLSNLSLDGLRLIFEILDLDSLVALHSTFNKFVMKSLRSPRAIRQLDLGLIVSASGALKYLIKHLRDVGDVMLPQEAQWSLSSLLLLQTLNPQRLILRSGLLHSSTLIVIREFLKHPEDASLVKLANFMKPLGFPNLEVITPRLHSLTVECGLDECISTRGASDADIKACKAIPLGISLPSTLTSISLPTLSLSHPTATIISSPTLYHLQVSKVFEAAFTELSHLFDNLESFKFMEFDRGSFTQSRVIQHMLLPRSLQTLSCGYGDFPQFLFQATHQPPPDDLSELKLPPFTFIILQPYCVSTFEFGTRDDASSSSFFWSSLLSPFPIATLTNLSIEFRAPCAFLFEEIPRSIYLQKLSVIARVVRRWKPFVSVVSPLDASPVDLDVAKLKLQDLPKGLQTLCLTLASAQPNQSVINPADIEFLPSNLKHLLLSDFQLSELDNLRLHLPRTHLHITSSFDWPYSKNGALLGSKLSDPILDFHAHMQSVDKEYTAKNVRFTVNNLNCPIDHRRLPLNKIGSAEELIWRPFTPSGGTVEWENGDQLLQILLASAQNLFALHLDGMKRGPNLRQFRFNCLTTANFGSCPMTGNWPTLPPSLTHLTATSTSYFDPALPTGVLHFSVLDTPNWSIPAAFLFRCAFRDSVLNCRVVSLLDTDVVRFLAKHVSRATRLKMSVELSIKLTKLSPPVENHSWEVETMESLAKVLNGPMPPNLLHSAAMDISQGENPIEKIGDVVRAFTCHP